MRVHRRRGWLRLVALVSCALVVVGLTSCSRANSESEASEVDDVGDVTVPGPLPTAPPEGEGPTSGAAAFIAELEALSDETDLCRILTGVAFQELLAGQMDVAGLLGTPAGSTQVIVLVDQIFDNVVTISPPELVGASTTLDGVWGRIAVIPSTAPDANEQALAILSEPQVVADLETLARWAAFNCEVPVTTTTAPGAPGATG